MQDDQEKVIRYASRLYSASETHYCITRRELLAIVYFTRYFKQYLLGRKFLIRTDPDALQWLQRTPDPYGQQASWLEQLSAYDFDIVHRPSVKQGNADGTSRIPCKQCGMPEDLEDSEILNWSPCGRRRAECLVERVDEDLAR